MRALRERNWVIGGARGAAARLGLKENVACLQDAEVGDLSLTLTKRCESVSSEKVVHDYGCPTIFTGLVYATKSVGAGENRIA